MKATGPLVRGSCSESSEESINLEELENTGISPAVAVHHVVRHMWLRNCPLADTAALHGNLSCCGSHCGLSAAQVLLQDKLLPKSNAQGATESTEAKSAAKRLSGVSVMTVDTVTVLTVVGHKPTHITTCK